LTTRADGAGQTCRSYSTEAARVATQAGVRAEAVAEAARTAMPAARAARNALIVHRTAGATAFFL
jgi:hypothetical protein